MTTTGTDLFHDAFARSRAMVILRGFDAGTTAALARRAVAAGVVLVEVPLQSAEAAAALRATVRAVGEEAVVGAGTITSVVRLEAAIGCGAAFTVAPGFDAEVVAQSAEVRVPHLPGVATATEVQRAITAGAIWLKAFPAAALGPGWFGAIAGPFPEARFVATGGIDAGNARRFLDAGASGVSLGASFASIPETELAALVSG